MQNGIAFLWCVGFLSPCPLLGASISGVSLTTLENTRNLSPQAYLHHRADRIYSYFPITMSLSPFSPCLLLNYSVSSRGCHVTDVDDSDNCDTKFRLIFLVEQCKYYHICPRQNILRRKLEEARSLTHRG